MVAYQNVTQGITNLDECVCFMVISVNCCKDNLGLIPRDNTDFGA